MTILFDGRFSAGATFDDYYRVDRNPAENATPQAAGVVGAYEYATDPVGSATVAKISAPNLVPGRTELRPNQVDVAGSGPEYGERWYAWWIFLPVDFVYPVNIGVDAIGRPHSRVIVAQLHETADGGEVVHPPPFSLYVGGDARYHLVLSNDENATTVDDFPNVRQLHSWPTRPGQWDEWVMNINIAADSNGFMRLYLNRRLQLSIDGAANTFLDTVGPYLKAGIYCFANAYTPALRTIYSRGIVIGDGDSSYEEVTGNAVLETPAARAVT